jgi:hypothetical protein
MLPWKVTSITYSDGMFVVLVIQHAKRMPSVILSFVACPAVPHFSTLSHKTHNFRETVTEHKQYILILSTTFV